LAALQPIPDPTTGDGLPGIKGLVVSQHLPRVPSSADWAPLRLTGGSFEPAHSRSLPTGPSPSLTYEPHYGLKEKPFSLSADPRFLYRSPAHAPAFDELLNGIRRREGLIVLTGEIGTGKTTLIRSVLQHLDRRTFTAFVPDPFLSREDLLKMLLVDFGVVSLADLKRGSLAGASRPDLSYPLYEFLDSLVPLQAFAVLIIDEAQNLPLTLLEEIRILSDLEQREKLLQVVLVGQPELKTHLKMPEMRQVDQRVSVRCELTSLGLTDVGKYIRHRLSIASDNGSGVQFSESAITAVFDASGGVPRVINLICDRALQRGHQVQATRIESALIHEAAESLGIEPPRQDAAVRSTATTDTNATAAPEVVKAIPLASPTSGSPQFESEFATEAELSGHLSNARSQSIAAAVVIAAFVAAASAVIVFLFLVNSYANVEIPALPARPTWSAIQAPLPEIEMIPRDRSATPARPVHDGSYAIQVASLTSRRRADLLVAELGKAGFRARRGVQPRVSTGVALRVRIDGYSNADVATRDLARIRALPGYGDAHLLSKQRRHRRSLETPH
jgi:type II secretory pathway predicted ATPase ExeA